MFFILFYHLQEVLGGGAQPIPSDIGWRQGISWTSCQFIAGLKWCSLVHLETHHKLKEVTSNSSEVRGARRFVRCCFIGEHSTWEMDNKVPQTAADWTQASVLKQFNTTHKPRLAGGGHAVMHLCHCHCRCRQEHLPSGNTISTIVPLTQH